tara:strand:+ start:396 stop:521 length:126 start_codon:yes stop_codon:yes gene_type:complete
MTTKKQEEIILSMENEADAQEEAEVLGKTVGEMEKDVFGDD